jgi:hypothetical protein
MLNAKCPACGSYNDDHATECYFCHKSLSAESGAAPANQQKSATYAVRRAPRTGYDPYRRRPGCLSFLALLYIIPNGISLAFLSFFALMLLDPTDFGSLLREIDAALPARMESITTLSSDGNFWYAIILAAGICGLSFFIGIGLWQRRNWARILVIFLQGSSLLLQMATIPLNFDALIESPFSIIPIATSVIFSFIIILWFLFNRDVFD